jgi:acyl-CoA synthetase (NDP forming)
VTQELARIFKPRSVAVIGASSNPDKLGYLLIKGFVDLDFSGRLYPINRDTQQRILDLDVHASVKKIRDDIDLAVITLPPQAALPTVKECIEKEIKGIILFSAFPEGMGSKDPEIKDTLSLAQQKGVRIIGPNSMGIYSPSAGLAIFAELPQKSGPVGFISHSGALAFAFSKYLGNREVGFSKVIACGNEWDLTWTDFLEYLGQDRETGIIAGYIEGIKDGTRFMRAASEITHRKPVIVIKGGKSSAGSQFVSSHTGSIAGNQDIWSSVFEQSGVLCVESFEELIEHVIVFNYFMHHPIGDRIAIVSGTGGPITMSADLCEKLGLQIPSLSAHIREKLKELMPPTGTSNRNPVDVSIAAATNVNLYTKPIELLDESDEVDMMLCIHTGDWRGEEVARAIAGIAHTIRKPLVVILVGTPEKSGKSITTLLEAGIPAFTSAEGALKALASLVKWKRKGQQLLL